MSSYILYIWKVDHVLVFAWRARWWSLIQWRVSPSLFSPHHLCSAMFIIMTQTHHQSDWCPLYWEWLMQHIYEHTQGVLAKTRKKKNGHIVRERRVSLIVPFSSWWKAKELQNEEFVVVRRRKRGEPGSEEVSSGRGLGVGLQKVNYVLVGGSLCHLLSCLSILGGGMHSHKIRWWNYIIYRTTLSILDPLMGYTNGRLCLHYPYWDQCLK